MPRRRPSPPRSTPAARITRRQILRGAGGLALALPLVEYGAGDARATTFPKRLVVMFSTNGTVDDAWKPAGTETDFTLGEIPAPLAPHAKDLLVLHGVDAESSYHGPGDNSHWNGMGHMLTATELVDLGQGVLWGDPAYCTGELPGLC